jgi:hypothetical protein
MVGVILLLWQSIRKILMRWVQQLQKPKIHLKECLEFLIVKFTLENCGISFNKVAVQAETC